MRRQIIELVAAVVAAAAAVWCWFGAQTIVTVAPILPGEPQTTSIAYSPPLLVLMLLLATLAGVLAVVGITGLITGGRVGSAAAALATGPTSASGPS
jgi:xanthosine utilization system XapX-like protein